MESALIVSGTTNSLDFLTGLLAEASVASITSFQTCGEARRFLYERDMDLVIVNSPLRDESGEDFSRYIASKGVSQVILIVKNEYFDSIAAACEADGVLTIAKPINKTVFWSALMLAKSAQNRIKKMQSENAALKQKIEDIRIATRAKLILISYMNMSEKEAHRYIEKQAMDLRTSRRSVAEGIIKTYEY